jgi:hypothetical protein
VQTRNHPLVHSFEFSREHPGIFTRLLSESSGIVERQPSAKFHGDREQRHHDAQQDERPIVERVSGLDCRRLVIIRDNNRGCVTKPDCHFAGQRKWL